jgi:hypothetical protein
MCVKKYSTDVAVNQYIWLLLILFGGDQFSAVIIFTHDSLHNTLIIIFHVSHKPFYSDLEFWRHILKILVCLTKENHSDNISISAQKHLRLKLRFIGDPWNISIRTAIENLNKHNQQLKLTTNSVDCLNRWFFVVSDVGL